MRLFMHRLRTRFSIWARTPAPAPRRGQSLVEMALVLPFLLVLLSSMAEFGFAFNRYVNVVEAVREGARFGVAALFFLLLNPLRPRELSA